MKNRRLLLSILMGMLLYGCFPLERSKIVQEPFQLDRVYRHSSPPQIVPGTIYRGGQTSNYFGDQRARMLGDIVTIKIVEISQASEKATTDTNRSSAMNAGISNLFGPVKNSNPINTSTANSYSGTGETTRTGTLTATVAVRVIEVMPTGNLAVEGKREIYVNNEKKEILVQGIIRPRDIAADNSVLSTQVADAKILMTGIGVVAEKQRPGWLTRVFDVVWPF